MSPDNEIPAFDQLCHEHDLSCLSPYFSTLRPCSRMLAYGLCSTARPPETLMGWYQRPRQSSLPWGFFTTTVYTPTLRYHQCCLSLSFFYYCYWCRFKSACAFSPIYSTIYQLVPNLKVLSLPLFYRDKRNTVFITCKKDCT